MSEYLTFKKNIEDAMDKYELTIIYKHIQDFVVDKFSNWYLEFLKFKENSYLIHYLFKQILILLHPFMPFLTDYVFEKLYHEELLCSNLQTLP
ncbi:class I tRNA ligase family protein [Metamycoplasma hominis]|uniref:class I tRNA ligase family protein n=1 Tax=Metamycoplasma hominis TaxID=2098 RepID=UPI001EEDD165|nr:class I tRNA ligase family protein [Metamycoplasma hominis]